MGNFCPPGSRSRSGFNPDMDPDMDPKHWFIRSIIHLLFHIRSKGPWLPKQCRPSSTRMRWRWSSCAVSAVRSAQPAPSLPRYTEAWLKNRKSRVTVPLSTLYFSFREWSFRKSSATVPLTTQYFSFREWSFRKYRATVPLTTLYFSFQEWSFRNYCQTVSMKLNPAEF